MNDSASLESAARTIANEKTGWSAVRWAAWCLFDAGRFDLAQHGFERLVAIGRSDADVIAALHAIYTDRGEFASAALLVERFLDEPGSILPPGPRFDWSVTLFDTLIADPAQPDRSAAALRLLEAAAATESNGWRVILNPDRRAAIDATLRDPSIALQALEQFLYAPATTGLPAEALARIEEIGCRHATDRELARFAERLLHAFGEPAAAYRVEECRRTVSRPAPAAVRKPPTPPASRICDLIVTVAGGHPALRSMARRDLGLIGIGNVREIPSAWEATRDSRAVQATLAGSDLVVVVARQIAHTTSDQVRAAATRLGVPIVVVQTGGVAAIHRAVERFLVDSETS